MSGQATLVETTSSFTRRWRSSSSTPTPTTTYHKNTSKVRCSKNAEGREPDFQQPGNDVYFQARLKYKKKTFRRFTGSAHVQHLRKHPAKYEAAVVDFLKRTMSTIEEEEVVEEVGKKL